MSTVVVDDFQEAAALRAARVPSVEAVLVGSRVSFQFDDSGGAATEALRKHRCGQLKVSTLSFCEALSSVKTEMFSVRRRGGLE